MICVAVTGRDTAAVLADMAGVAGLADLVEVRLDYVANPDLQAIIAATVDIRRKMTQKYQVEF